MSSPFARSPASALLWSFAWRRRSAYRRAARPARIARCRRSAANCRARQWRHRDGETAVDVAHDFFAGETVAIDRVGDEPAFWIVERDRPIARRRRHAADRECAAAVQIIAGIVGMGVERYAVAHAGRQFAAARNAGARIRIDIDRSALWPCRPGADGQRTEGDAARQREPRRAKPESGGDQQRETRTEQQAHVGSDRTRADAVSAISRRAA